MQPREVEPGPSRPEIAQQSAKPLYAPDGVPTVATPDDAVLRDQPRELPVIEPIAWQGPEYLQSDKLPSWYIGLFVVVLLFIGVAIYLQAWTFVALIIVMTVALMLYAHRPPREINYAVSDQGLHINDTLHPLGEFKSFGVLQQAGHNALVFIPVKRFYPALTIYFPTEVGENLVDLLGGYLPMQEVKLDAFDKIVQKLHL